MTGQDVPLTQVDPLATDLGRGLEAVAVGASKPEIQASDRAAAQVIRKQQEARRQAQVRAALDAAAAQGPRPGQTPQDRLAEAYREVTSDPFAERFPQLAKKFQDVNFVGMALDDLGSLKTSEGVWDWVGRSWGAAMDASRRGSIGSAALLAGRRLSAGELEELEAINRRARIHEDRPGGFLGSAIELVGSFSEGLATGAATGAVAAVASGPAAPVGFAAGMAANSLRLEAGNLYADLVAEHGYTPAQALPIALTYGSAISAVDLLSFKVASKPFASTARSFIPGFLSKGLTPQTRSRAFSQAAKEYLTSLGVEPTTEAVQEIIGMLGEENARLLYRPDAPSTFEFSRAGEAFSHTFKGMVVLGGVGAGATAARNLVRAADSEHTARVFAKMGKIEAESKISTRNPEERANLVNQMAESAGSPNIYVRGDKFQEIIRRVSQEERDAGGPTTEQQIEELLPGILHQAEIAADTGGDVVIPTGDFFARLRNTAVGKEIADGNATFDPDGLTPNEGRAMLGSRESEVADAAEVMTAEQEGLEARNAELDAVAGEVSAQIRSTGRLPASQVRAVTEPFRAFVDVMSREQGLSPREFHDRFPLRVVASGDANLAQGERGGFNEKRLTAILFEGADASTVIHESGHYFLTVMESMAQQEGASRRIKDDFAALLKWMNVEPDAWAKLDDDARRKKHEAVAYGFERYLYEGVAPNARLRRTFQRISAWLRALYQGVVGRINEAYKSETGQDLPGLTPEVRGVFDRMIASQQSIEEAEAVRGFTPLYEVREDGDFSDEAWQDYQEAQEAARNEAADDLVQKALSEGRYLNNAGPRRLKELQREEQAARRRVRNEVREELSQQPVHRLRHWLRTGERGGVTDDSHKLDADVVRAMLPDGMDLRNVPRGTSKGGVHPDRIAPVFGYESGEAMVRDLAESPKFDAAVESATDERMRREHSEFFDEEARRAAVEEALHSEARAQLLAKELRRISETQQPIAQIRAAIKEAARRHLEGRRVRDIRPRDFSAAEGRAARKAARAVKDGDVEAATRYKYQQLVQNELARQALKARADVDKAKRSFESIFRSDEKIADRRDLNIASAARAILGAFGFGRAMESPLTWLQPVAEYDPEVFQELAPIVQRATDRATEIPGPERWRDLTLSEFHDMRETVEMLWHRSRRQREMQLEGQKQRVEAVAARATERLDEILPEKPDVTESPGPLKTARNFLLGWAANATRVEAMFLTLDGGSPGIFTSMFRRVKEAGDAYRTRTRNLLERYESLLRSHDFGPNRQIDASADLGHIFRNKAELLGALRHTGNDSNRKKLLVGRGWGEIVDGNLLDDRKWQAFVERMIENGTLTKADFDLVQSIWDLNESLKADAQKAHYEAFGYRFREVEAKPFTVQFKDGSTASYRGGYVPASVDSEVDPRARSHEINTQADFHRAFASVPKGFTLTRNELYARPLSLRLQDGSHHLAQVARFIHMHVPVNEIRRALHHRDVEGRLVRRNPSIFDQILDPWLNRSALQSSSVPAASPAETVIGWLSRSANMGIMFGNIGNSVQNLSGWMLAALKVPPGRLISSVLSYATGPGAMRERVTKLSPHMANRLQTQMFEIHSEIRRQGTQQGPLGSAADWMRRNTYFLQQITQNVVDITSWDAAYNHATAQGLDSAEAVRRADAAVRQTQMATDPEDISSWEYASPLWRALFPFQSWFINWINTTSSSFRTANTMGERFGVYVYGVMLPLVVAQLISDGINGRLEDEDGDGWGDDLAGLWLRSQLLGTLSAIPVAGSAGKLVTNFFDDQVWNDRFPAPPFADAVTRGAQAMRDFATGDATSRDTRDLVRFFGVASGLPLQAIGDRAVYISDVAAGRVQPESTADQVRGVLTGR